MSDPRSTQDPLPAAWKFCPKLREPPRASNGTAFSTRLEAALRTGHGLVSTLELEITSGPHSAITVRAFDPSGARWFGRAILPVYPAHEWEPTVSIGSTGSVVGRVWTARRTFSWPEPLAPAAGASLDALVTTLRSSPSGARLRVRSSPLPPVTLHWWDRALPDSSRPRISEVRRTIDPVPEPPGPAAALSVSRPLFWRVGVTLEMPSRSPAALSPVDLCGAMASASRTPRGNGFVFRPARRRSWVRTVGGDSFIVSVDELPRFWPSPECDIGVESPASGQAPRLLALGRTREGVVVGPLLEEHQGRHLAVLGETGMGKSSLLIALARRALGSAGGVVMDPLGETVRSLREELGPAERERCLWVAPDASEVALNALEGIGAGENRRPGAIRASPQRSRSCTSASPCRALLRIGVWGPRIEEMVTRALRAAAAFPDGTLLDAHTLLASSARLGRPIPLPASEAVRELADRIRDRPEDADGARRLLHEVVRSPVLARLLCARHPTVGTRDLVAPGRIVLISGDAARVGESTARYLLSVLLALVWSELLARAEIPKTFVVLDEAQWFSHESLAEMLRLGRRKNVHVVLATQAVASLPEAVREAVWTNASDFVAFRGSPEEAREFARAVPGISAEEILGLPRGEAAVLIGKGESVRWLRTIRRPLARASSGPGEGIGRSGASSPPVNPAPRAAPSPPTPTLDRIFVELLHDGAETPGEDPLVVDLVEFRRRVDPRGDGIREAGGILSRSGALTRVERSDGGHRWVIDRSRLAEVVSRRGVTSPGESVSRLPQPS